MSLDRGVIGDAIERSVDNLRRDAVGHRDSLEGGQPIAETFGAVAAFCGPRGRDAKDRRRRKRKGPRLSNPLPLIRRCDPITPRDRIRLLIRLRSTT